ncbi:hypothetical protein HELRODRAFT_180369 [Helobdella robusta]|uniref:Uncharacterized protein n=1 Tax=Helobdella robusta TaxID=6412 RepID=T1FFU5_HELRO|nr:hypothetical protein HELRODRAFT_180369 [Helobdella robusta]ESN93958.1 hypothetical protein HELRODRAFT_180369 [Helobdella robusta]
MKAGADRRAETSDKRFAEMKADTDRRVEKQTADAYSRAEKQSADADRRAEKAELRTANGIKQPTFEGISSNEETIPKTTTQVSEIILPAYSPTGDVDCNARDISDTRGICDARDTYDAGDNYDARDNGKGSDNCDARVDVQKVIGRLTDEKNELNELTGSNDSDDEKVNNDRLDRLGKDFYEITDRNILKSKGQSHQQELEEIE